MSKRSGKKFKFNRQADVGALDAARDGFLEECFFDKGDLQALADLGNHKSIIIGRTGSGKSALIERLQSTQPGRVIFIDPHDLSLSYIANNNTLREFERLGVSLKPFYRVLWKHVFVTEIIRCHFNIETQRERDNLFTRLDELLHRNKAKQEAIQYFRDWGDKFWETTEIRVKEIVKKAAQELERSVNGNVSASIPATVTGGMEASQRNVDQIAEEQRLEVITHGQRVISDIQLDKLQKVIDVLDQDILTDRQRFYYICIDRLDEEWVEDELRYRLIFELLSVISELNIKLQHKVKIIIALREDLLQTLYRFIQETQRSGFQQEKYEDLYFRLNWSPADLKTVLKRRVENLHVRQYTNENVTLDEVFPASLRIEDTSLGKTKRPDSVSYLLSRTMLVPRDVIRFANKCIEEARTANVGSMSKTILMSAERGYSEARLTALADEWRTNYPNLAILCQLIRGFPSSFTIMDINYDDFQSKFDSAFTRLKNTSCPIYEIFLKAYEADGPELKEIMSELLSLLYRVGVVGLEKSNSNFVAFSFSERTMSFSDFLEPSNKVHIHPAFYFSLAIKLKK